MENLPYGRRGSGGIKGGQPGYSAGRDMLYFRDVRFMKKYAAEMGFKMDPVTPEDPQSNGFAEAFVKILCKLLHTSVAKGKNPREELHKYLMHYRATSHPRRH